MPDWMERRSNGESVHAMGHLLTCLELSVSMFQR
ncbi:hypothetical protein STIAU_8804 [Stigmatella aurantiaca DW4/3-1]|uniref:Uncharacterized protein n=1 Tax=Stigmatella aurantiaca (strain DW4/3-1) TaxID=378806 RepID=Q09A39_STIAD|nr:hypothetical protein STIAU_8804 [Stigmatella aurantiaca DW4/3-1]